MIQCEDEWTDIRHRFKKESLDFNNLKSEEHVIFIWRWLVDCESNLKNFRKMFDKFRDQQHEEMEEMENYIVHMQDTAEQKASSFETECVQLKQQIQSISHIVSPLSLQGNTLIEKITDLVEEYTKCKEEIQEANKLQSDALHNDDIVSEMIKVSSEKEILKREIEEISERMKQLKKRNKELELDNEKLIFKLSEAFNELEEKEVQLGELTTASSSGFNDYINFTKSSRESNKNNAQYSDAELYINGENIAHNFSKKESSIGADSTSPSLMISEMASFNSVPKLSNLMDTCHELSRLEENKLLQSECESMKNQLANLGEKYNNLALKYIQLKSKRRFQTEEIRGRLDASQCHIQTLQTQLSVQRQRIRAEEMFRRQIERDLSKLQEEKRAVCLRLMNAEMEQRESNREVTILQKKVYMLDTANSELLAKVLRLKYKEPSLPKNTCDNILPIGSV